MGQFTVKKSNEKQNLMESAGLEGVVNEFDSMLYFTHRIDLTKCIFQNYVLYISSFQYNYMEFMIVVI